LSATSLLIWQVIVLGEIVISVVYHVNSASVGLSLYVLTLVGWVSY